MIASYKRIKVVTESPSLILEALRESSVLQVNEAGTHVRRTSQYSGTDKDEGKDAKMAHAVRSSLVFHKYVHLDDQYFLALI